MLTVLIGSALRSLFFALIVWVGLRIFRIQNVDSQRNAWTVVLIGSLLMPVALPLAAHFHALPVVAIRAPAALDQIQSGPGPTSSIGPSTVVPMSDPETVSTRADRLSTPSGSNQLRSQGLVSTHTFPAGPLPSLVGIAWLIYVLIAAALLIRVLLGILSALRLWRSSIPIATGRAAEIAVDFNLRVSRNISTPVTVGSGVVLPADYTSWTEEKLRVVLAHERSHVRLHDFYVQTLASLYAALAWFSPLGWWLKLKLSDLGEAISDRSGLNAASDRSAYAQVLLEFAAAPHPTLIGVAMARSSNISRRIERLLSDSYLRHAFSDNARARVAVLIVPAVLFAGAALVHVDAATEPNSVATAVSTAPAAHSTAVTPATTETVSARAPRELALAVPPPPAVSTAALENGAAETEATFDRNLTFNGTLTLVVGTGSGNITLTRGSANQIRIHGIVKANHDADPAQVQQVAANPPIEQQGNSIQIGGHQENMRNISISYEIQAPADTELNAATGSGNITDTGVGHEAKLTTGSGNINATGIEGGFKSQTGSGNIVIDGSGQGEARAQTGSGNIDLKGVAGALQAQTGSGEIKAEGKPSSLWKLQAGSGSIALATGNAPMDLDASTGSGTISTNPSSSTPSSADHHHLHTQLNGGGPEVRVQTGSGDIHVD